MKMKEGSIYAEAVSSKFITNCEIPTAARRDHQAKPRAEIQNKPEIRSKSFFSTAP